MTVGRGFDAVTFEDVGDRARREVVAEVREGTQNTVVTPGPVLLRHADNQSFEIGICSWPSRLSLAVILLCDELPVPGQQGVWSHDSSDPHQCASAELLGAIGGRVGVIRAVAEPPFGGFKVCAA